MHQVTQTSSKIASPWPYWIPDQSKLHALFSKQHKAGFRREGHNYLEQDIFQDLVTLVTLLVAKLCMMCI